MEKCKKCERINSDFCHNCSPSNDCFVVSSVIKDKIKKILSKVEKELHNAIKHFPLGFHSNHEALGVLREEYIEFENEIFDAKEIYRKNEKQTKEAIQVAAMSIRFILDIPEKSEEWPTLNRFNTPENNVFSRSTCLGKIFVTDGPGPAEIIKSTYEAASGLISEKFIQANLDYAVHQENDSVIIKYFPDIARITTVLSIREKMDCNDIFRHIVHGLIKEDHELLSDMGFLVNSLKLWNEDYQKYCQDRNKNWNELTSIEKHEAFIKHIITQGQEIVKNCIRECEDKADEATAAYVSPLSEWVEKNKNKEKN